MLVKKTLESQRQLVQRIHSKQRTRLEQGRDERKSKRQRQRNQRLIRQLSLSREKAKSGSKAENKIRFQTIIKVGIKVGWRVGREGSNRKWKDKIKTENGSKTRTLTIINLYNFSY